MKPQQTPITYYGGKKNMLKYILPMIPEHTVYCEPFFGGGAVFFAKKPAQCEMINDINDYVINFYKVYRTKTKALIKAISTYLLSRTQHKQAQKIFQKPKGYSDVQRAAAFWFLSNVSFNGDFYGNIKFSKNHERSYRYVTQSRNILIDPKTVLRIEQTQIDCRDALYVINSMDSIKTFHYLDPPYHNADMGHYYGYTEQDYINLLDKVQEIKGKFLLSCYPNDILDDYIKRNNWNTKEIKMRAASGSHHQKGSRRIMKIEKLTWNYSQVQGEMFE